jgi:hypothetical protein
MSLKKIEQVKLDKGFKIFDIVVYILLALTIVALFIAFVFTKDASQVTSFKISFVKNGDRVTVFTYDYDLDSYQISDEENIQIVSDEGGQIKLYFYVDSSHDKYNYIIIDKSSHSVWVEDGNCHNLNCKELGKLTTNNQVITCTPHNYMIIEPNDYEVSSDEIG